MGLPVTVTAKLEGLPTRAVADATLVIVGACCTVRAKVWLLHPT